MEFGIFSQMHVPPWDDEHLWYLREIEVALACDAAGFKYDWSPEHHFLQNYSHQPAPEVFLSWVAARTRRIHVGFAICNLTAAVNHPARAAERIATMDHLSEGRVEFGTGRGSSSAEWGGFAIPSAAETKPMWKESLEQIPRMCRTGRTASRASTSACPSATFCRSPSRSRTRRCGSRARARRRSPKRASSASGRSASPSARPRRSRRS